MTWCAIEGCNNSDRDIKLFRFPSKDCARREQWAKFANYPKQNTPMICAKHFETKHFCNSDPSNILLRSTNPVPTLHGPKPDAASKVEGRFRKKLPKTNAEKCDNEDTKPDIEIQSDSKKETKPAVSVISSKPIYLPNSEKVNSVGGESSLPDHNYNENPPEYIFTVNSEGKTNMNSLFGSSSLKQLHTSVSEKSTANSVEMKSFRDGSTQTEPSSDSTTLKLFDDPMDVEIDNRLNDPSLEMEYRSVLLGDSSLFGDLPYSNLLDPDGENLRGLSRCEKARRSLELYYLRQRLVQLIRKLDKIVPLFDQDETE